jgi:hypothetical protein
MSYGAMTVGPVLSQLAARKIVCGGLRIHP